MRLLRYSLFFLAVLPALVPAPATAQTPAAAEAAGADSAVSFGYPVNGTALASHRGGDLTLTNTTLSGVTAENSASQVVTGTNAIGGGSFANLSGIPVVIQNTGANVLIQNAVTLNLQLK
jgi:hypothetical protein